MVSATLMRPNTSAPSDGSRTLTLLDVQSRPSGSNDEPVSSTDPAPLGVLMLRGGPRRTRRRVAWDEDVVDNEGAGRKKSKICCIYNKPKRFDESSSEESSDSDSDSDSDCGHGHGHHRHALDRASRRRPTGHEDGVERDRGESSGVIHELEEDHEPNAYEVGPSKKGKRKAT